MSYFEQIWNWTRQIPKGKVTTYGAIAKLTGVNGRVVGWALHKNKDPLIPCHRVVTKDGELADSYAFGGQEEQRKRLMEEGISFIDETHVDIKNFIFPFGEEASR